MVTKKIIAYIFVISISLLTFIIADIVYSMYRMGGSCGSYKRDER